ncbi:MAG TPA: ATP-binding protein [Fibrobacteria bacterium]|nr:ATP-binding protein [Fibrobacteria bacterium]
MLNRAGLRLLPPKGRDIPETVHVLAAETSMVAAITAIALAGVIASQGGRFQDYAPMLIQFGGFLLAHIRARARKADSFQMVLGLVWLTVVLFDDGFMGQGVTWVFYIPLSLGILLFLPRGWNQNMWLASIPFGLLLVGLTDWTPRMNRLIPEHSAYFTRSSNFVAAILTSLFALRYMLEQHGNALAKAIAANQAKSEFLSHMSHEFRTPLNAISGFTELLQLDPAVRQGSGKESLQAIRSSSEHLLSLVNSVLDLSSMENGKLPLHMASFDPRRVLDELVATLGPLAGSKRLEIRSRIDDDLPRIVGDRLRWLQVLLNLCSNGIRYTQEGHLEIRASWDASRSSMVATIRDTGPGIPQHKLSSIFEPYTRLEESNPTQAHGTGLGLAISKQLVETMGGTLAVESRVGEGTVFRYLQPFDVAQDEPAISTPAQDPAALASLQGKRVLLCEDTRMNVLLAVRVLGQLGAELEVAEDGRQSLEKLARGGWDLVLLDLHMPYHDGYEVARRVRDPSSPIPCKRVPILALTADASDEARDKAFAMGVDDLLTKPFKLSELAQRANRLVNS